MNNLKSSPKDVFLHLLSIITLYISAGGLVALFFQYINLAFPDQLYPNYYYSVAGPIRWAMASLIIVFPVYLFTNWLLQNDYAKNPEKRELRIRKWLVHFTLFAAAIIIMVDLVTLVYNFLGGDLTARFSLKIIAVLLVIGSIFAYYLWDLRKGFSGRQLRSAAISSGAVILISVIAGFFTAGSPFTARLYKFDEQRVSDLQTLQNEIVNYWINKDTLPPGLESLKNDISGFVPPGDPENNSAYGYQKTGKLAFELCANFSLSSPGLAGNRPKAMPYYGDAYNQNWSHEQGKACFSRSIDPELYPKTAKPTHLESTDGRTIIY